MAEDVLGYGLTAVNILGTTSVEGKCFANGFALRFL